MNITPVPAAVPQILPSHLGKQSGEEGPPVPQEQSLPLVAETKKDKKEEKVPEVKLDDLLMKPTPLPLEERLSQIISAEEVKDLLSLVTRSPALNKDDEHKVDVKR
ncbi:hypothetical protein LPTSP3_g10970 [Leptospira kobayashii]|uniref:Uncharacterized protein n=1 Tax=Leptospira kobayashii TaxID=1917830 RepID=A0ABN6KB57_9LEPT|nr:hypothetical protein [Leptospira kobayashii]BDA78167.1 hypothetical protein LPTSP3_g10970 [Leptospira kobayashii]